MGKKSGVGNFLWFFAGLCFLLISFSVFYQYLKEYFVFLTDWSNAKCELVSAGPVASHRFSSAPLHAKIVGFSLDDPDAKEVFLCGSFYDGEKIPLTKTGDSLWQVEVFLTGGKYFYNFEIDGKITPDKKNPETTKLEGKIYSALTVKE